MDGTLIFASNLIRKVKIYLEIDAVIFPDMNAIRKNIFFIFVGNLK